VRFDVARRKTTSTLSAFSSREKVTRRGGEGRKEERHAEQRVPLGLGAAAEERQRVRTRQAGVLPSEIVMPRADATRTQSIAHNSDSHNIQRENRRREKKKK